MKTRRCQISEFWINGVFKRDRLGILHKDGFALAETAVVRIGDFFGAFLGAGAAGDAFFHVDKARVLHQVDLKIAFITGYTLDLGKRQ